MWDVDIVVSVEEFFSVLIMCFLLLAYDLPLILLRHIFSLLSYLYIFTAES